ELGERGARFAREFCPGLIPPRADFPRGVRMGFDVTFHPIGADQLRHFLFDVLDDGSLAAARAAELSAEPKHRKVLDQLYESFPGWLAGRGAPPVGNSFAVVAAVIAGFLHPYWYARGTALTFLAEEHLPEMKSLFVPLGRLG